MLPARLPRNLTVVNGTVIDVADREEVRQRRGGSRLAPVHRVLEAHAGTGEENEGEEAIPREYAGAECGVDENVSCSQANGLSILTAVA